jgi:hypothetical protein
MSDRAAGLGLRRKALEKLFAFTLFALPILLGIAGEQIIQARKAAERA